jgi:hypothetical protein
MPTLVDTRAGNPAMGRRGKLGLPLRALAAFDTYVRDLYRAAP